MQKKGGRQIGGLRSTLARKRFPIPVTPAALHERIGKDSALSIGLTRNQHHTVSENSGFSLSLLPAMVEVFTKNLKLVGQR